MPFFMGEIFISSLKISWVNPEIFRDENEIFMHENENFAHEMKISGMKFFVRGSSLLNTGKSPFQCQAFVTSIQLIETLPVAEFYIVTRCLTLKTEF